MMNEYILYRHKTKENKQDSLCSFQANKKAWS